MHIYNVVFCDYSGKLLKERKKNNIFREEKTFDEIWML